MFSSSIKPYRFTILECYLLKRVEKIYLNSGYSFYRWPEVYFGNFDDFPLVQKVDSETRLKEDDLYYYNIDYLGLYVYDSYKEGHIRIFKDRIIKCANKIANSLQLNEYHVINDLLTIVLIHEIGHWFTHSCHVDNKRIRLKGFLFQETIIKESMAQLTVVWAIMKLKNPTINRLTIVFDYLVKRQPYPYQEFRQLGKKQSHVKTLLKRYGYIADDYEYNAGYDFNYFLQGLKVYKNPNHTFS